MQRFDFSQRMAREWFHYEPETGILTWKIWRGGTAYPRSRAGSVGKRGYRVVTMNGSKVPVTHIIFLWMEGKLPVKFHSEVDHINRVQDDDRWENLRLVDRARNIWNSGPRVTSRLYSRGITQRPNGRYRMRIYVNGKIFREGSFTTLEEAETAYTQAWAEREQEQTT